MENYSELHNICVKVFEAVASTTSAFILPLFLGKIVFSNIMGDGSKVGAALKGAVLYFALVAGFPFILEILFSIPEAYLPKFESLRSFVEDSPGWDISTIPFSVDRIIEVILAGLYWVVYYLHVFFMILMCSMAPVVFLLSTILGVGLGLEVFIGLLVIGSTWPIIWFGFDQVHTSLIQAQNDAFGAKCLELLITLFKGLAPVSFASLAIKSPAGRAVTQSVKGAAAVAKWSGIGAMAATSSIVPRMRSRGSNLYQNYEHRQKSKPKSSGSNRGSSGFTGSYFYSSPRANSDRLRKAKLMAESKGVAHENSSPRNS